MAKVFYVFQMRVEKPHKLNERMGILLPFFPVFYRDYKINHLLNMASIFAHDKMIPRGIILHVRN